VNSNVLFGEAYEQKFIEMLEQDSTLDINERMLEHSLGMPVDELKKLEKI